jgi:hypothetical protein
MAGSRPYSSFLLEGVNPSPLLADGVPTISHYRTVTVFAGNFQESVWPNPCAVFARVGEKDVEDSRFWLFWSVPNRDSSVLRVDGFPQNANSQRKSHTISLPTLRKAAERRAPSFWVHQTKSTADGAPGIRIHIKLLPAAKAGILTALMARLRCAKAVPRYEPASLPFADEIQEDVTSVPDASFTIAHFRLSPFGPGLPT